MSALERSIDEAPTEALHDAARAELAALRAEVERLRGALRVAKGAAARVCADGDFGCAGFIRDGIWVPSGHGNHCPLAVMEGL
jgi:hypothetical protein